MALIERDWIAADAVNGDNFRLDNNQYLKARNFLDSANVNIIKVNADNAIEFASVPLVTADPSVDNALTRKSWVVTQLGNYQATSAKNQNSGYCGLDANGKVASSQLPSYVDDVLEYADFASLPVSGSNGIIYVTLDDNKTYRWSGSAYIEISPSAVTSVCSKSGAVTLYTDDISEDGSPVNLWFTDARAKAAAVADSITNGVTDVAASQNAVYDALALKSNTGHTHVAADITDFSSAAKTAAVVDSTAGTQTDQAASVSSMKSFVTTAISNIAQHVPKEKEITLSAGDITNQYVDLDFEAVNGSLFVWPVGGPLQSLTSDYTVNYTGGAGGVTRVTFAGDLALKLIAGKILTIKYLKV